MAGEGFPASDVHAEDGVVGEGGLEGYLIRCVLGYCFNEFVVRATIYDPGLWSLVREDGGVCLWLAKGV